MAVRRIYVEKKPNFDIQAKRLLREFKESLGISGIEKVRVINRYDIEGISEDDYEKAKTSIFSEPPVDYVFEEDLPFSENDRLFAVELLPGQYDQRADSCAQCVQLLSGGERPEIRTAVVIVIEGDVCDSEFEKIKNFYINPVESREAEIEKPETLRVEYPYADDVKIIRGFISMDDEELKKFIQDFGFAMSFEDLEFCREYFLNKEKRDPTVTELRVLDTYWSDHCRHTTFQTKLSNVEYGKVYMIF
jgi:phosphoribosylformylglycinamidine synthase